MLERTIGRYARRRGYGTPRKLKRLPPRRFNRLRIRGLVHQPGQIRNVNCDTPRFSFCGQFGSQSAGKLIFKIDADELLPTVIAHDKAGGFLLNRQRRSRPILWAIVGPPPKRVKKSHFAAPSKSHHRTARASLTQTRHPRLALPVISRGRRVNRAQFKMTLGGLIVYCLDCLEDSDPAIGYSKVGKPGKLACKRGKLRSFSQTQDRAETPGVSIPGELRSPPPI